MQDMIEKLFASIESLRETIEKRAEVSEQRAVAEYDYRNLLGREMARLKTEGMAATALYNYARGIAEVAELRAQRDILIAQEEYLTELIFYHRQCIKVYENQANAERHGL